MTSKKLILILVVLIALVGLVFLFKKATPAISKDVHIEESATTYTIKADVSRTGNTSLDASIEAYVTAQAREFAEMYAPTMFSEEDFKALGFADGRQYELVIKGGQWKYKKLTGVTIELYTFTGGAHGSTLYVPFIADEAGIPITLESLFVPGAPYLDRVSEGVKPLLKAQLDEGQMYTEDFFTTGTTASEGNFFIDEIGSEGITFIFQQYQVAPYVAGTPRVTLSLASLADILNPAYFE